MKKELYRPAVHFAYLPLTALSLLPASALAEGDGIWVTAASPGYLFLVEEDTINSQNYLIMTAFAPGLADGEAYWGPVSGSSGSTFLMDTLITKSDLRYTWHFNSDTQATVDVLSCTTNCLWQAGQQVTLTKIFGDNRNLQVGGDTGGGGGDLFEGAPDPAGASKEGENKCNSGRHKYYTQSTSGCDVVDDYRDVLNKNGWNTTLLDSGCTPWGGGAKMEATKGGRYLFMNAGGPSEFANIDLCVWPSRPANTDCDQDCDDD